MANAKKKVWLSPDRIICVKCSGPYARIYEEGHLTLRCVPCGSKIQIKKNTVGFWEKVGDVL